MKDVIHQPHQGCRSIQQPERHNQPFEKALFGFEGNISYIGGFDSYLVISRIQFELVEIFSPLELVQKVINPWDWIPILDRDFVQDLIINT